jgi:excisionase family DNA binding protein
MTQHSSTQQAKALHSRARRLQAQAAELARQLADLASEAQALTDDASRLAETSTPAVQPLLYDVKQAADALSLGESSVRYLIATGKIASVQVQTSRRIPVTTLGDYVESLTSEAEAA